MPNRTNKNRRGGRKTPNVALDVVPMARPASTFRSEFNLSIADTGNTDIQVTFPAGNVQWRATQLVMDVCAATPSSFFLTFNGANSVQSRVIVATQDLRTVVMRHKRNTAYNTAATGGTVSVITLALSGGTTPVSISGVVTGSYLV